VIDDDKTTEIVIPNHVPAPSMAITNQALNSPKSYQGVERRKGSQASQALSLKPSFFTSLRLELSEDWTLKILAALTILALSLLVL
jgi:hypothetical protein